ncbi:MAG: hypothetical protein AB7N65_26785 [Vicinamibacterales bacterium]
MIDGLKLTMSGTALRQQLAARIQWHRSRVMEYQRELARQEVDDPSEVRLPEHIVEHMRDEHESRADVLALIHEHILEAETYHLGRADLIFAELIPDPDAD